MVSGGFWLLLAALPALSTASPECAVSEHTPIAGPVDGGTLVNVSGVGLEAGSSWQCSFGEAAVGAEYDEAVDFVTCYAPPASAGAATLNVSINGGGSWCAGTVLNYQFYPPPNVTSISPASGNAAGGTNVTVTGSGFAATGVAACAFGVLHVGDERRAGALAPAIEMSDQRLVCASPSAADADAVGVATFSFDKDTLPAEDAVQPCVDIDYCTLAPARAYHYASGHNVTLLGDAEHLENVVKLTKNLFTQIGSMIVSLYYPGYYGGVPVRTFDASWTHTIGRGSGADGYSFVFGDLRDVRDPFAEMGVGDGLVVRFRTYAYFGEDWNVGHGLLQIVYNDTLLNETHMENKLREPTRYGLGLNAAPTETGSGYLEPARVRVIKDATTVSVIYGNETVLVAVVDEWRPEVYWQFGFGARTGDRKDDHWIDDLRLQSGYLLDTGDVAFGVSLNGGSDVSVLPETQYTYTAYPAVLSLSPTTGPTRGNTTVRLVGSMLRGGADYRCLFGSTAEHGADAAASADQLDPGVPTAHDATAVVPATLDSEGLLVCASPPHLAGVVTLEASLNNRHDSSSSSRLPFRFYLPPTIDDARGPSRYASPAGGGANVSLLGANFSHGDDYRVVFEHAERAVSFDIEQPREALAVQSGVLPWTAPAVGGHARHAWHAVSATAYDLVVQRPRFTTVQATFVNDSLVVCLAPPYIGAQQATLRLTLNGQQYTEPPSSFPFFAVRSLSPNTGAVVGGTLVTVNGTAFDAGGAYRCRFGAAGEVQASRVDDQTLRCVSPPAADGAAALEPLEVALNARDFTLDDVGFLYFTALDLAAVDSVLPASGPVDGGTHVAVRGPAAESLRGGSHYKCRFGSVEVPATFIADAPLAAAFVGPHANKQLRTREWRLDVDYPESGHDAVLCVAPAHNDTSLPVPSAKKVPFAVSLNGLDFSNASSGYTYYHAPTVGDVAPLAGPVAGGTILTARLSPTYGPLLNATSCRIGPPSFGPEFTEHLPFVHGQRVYAQLSAVSLLEDGVVQCVAPPAERTGALQNLTLTFSTTHPSQGVFHGDAQQVTDRVRPCEMGPVFSCGGEEQDGYSQAASAHCEWLCPTLDGVARLTNGSLASSGALILHTPLRPLAPPPTEFNITFDVLVAFSDLEGDGRLTFNLGELPNNAFGIHGIATGLSVHLLGTREPRLEVWLRGKLLRDRELGDMLRVGAWLPCNIEVARGRLSLTLARTLLVDKLELPGWAVVTATPREHTVSEVGLLDGNLYRYTMPAPHWRFGFSAISGISSHDVYALDNIHLVSAALVAHDAQPIHLALNGQQFVDTGLTYSYYGAADWPHITALSPSSGPVEGGTILRVAVRGMGAYYNLTLLAPDPRVATSRHAVDAERIASPFLSAYRCFLGADNITANHVNDTVRCSTIPFEAVAGCEAPWDEAVCLAQHNLSCAAACAVAVPLKVSMNAQHALGAPPTALGSAVTADSAVAFTVYGVVTATAAAPLSGPSDGNTLVTFSGSGFTNGSDYRCRFGDGLAVDEVPGSEVVLGGAIPEATARPDVSFATYDAASGTISCYSPAATPSVVPLYLSLNSQNYARAGALHFAYTPPLVPTSVSPTTGPSAGDTLVTVAAGAMAGGFLPKCMFGEEVVPAWYKPGTEPANSSLQCTAPTATASAARRTLRLLHSSSPEQDPHPSWLQGDAELIVNDDDAWLRLTTADMEAAGSLILPPDALNSSVLPHRHFRVSFEVRMYGGDGGDGLSFSYGFLPPSSLGEQGGGLGLRVSILTAARCPGKQRPALDENGLPNPNCPLLTVHYAHEMLFKTVLPLGLRDWYDTGWAQVVVEYSAAGLFVSHNGTAYLEHGDMLIEQWAPQPSWSFGIGARCGMQTDKHELRRFTLELGPEIDATVVPLRVSLNAQQYVDTGGFTYFGLPRVQTLSPTSGPALGGTPNVLLVGGGAHTLGTLVGGSHYKCRFGGNPTAADQIVPATAGMADDVYCTAPAGSYGGSTNASATGGMHVAVSLNGQQFHPLVQNFSRWQMPPTADLAGLPVSGPTAGGTLVRVSMSGPGGMSGGDDYRCRFGPLPVGNETRASVAASEADGAVVAATWSVDGSDAVECTSPAAAYGAGTVKLQVSPNAQHFTPVLDFVYYDGVVLSEVSPSSGPTSGDTSLTVTGAGLAGGSKPECWLGTGRVEATVSGDGTSLECTAPTALGLGATELRIALNAQQASSGLGYVYYETPGLYALYPDNGDVAGMTLVTINATGGNSFANGSDYRCHYEEAGSSGEVGSGEAGSGSGDVRGDFEAGSGSGSGAAAPSSPQNQSETTATYDATGGTLSCYSPAFPQALVSDPAAVSAFRITLNGQQYGLELSFGVHEPPLVTSITPSSGPFVGGTLVEVTGSGFADRSGTAPIVCRFGEAPNATVFADWVSSTKVRCYVPHGDLTLLERQLQTGFDDPSPPVFDDGVNVSVALYGNATIQGGALRLTEKQIGQVGTYALQPRTRGTPYFSARLSVMLGSQIQHGTAAGDGLAFCYGHLPDGAWGEQGVADALCVRLRTHTALVLEVTCNATLLASVPMGEGTFAMRSGSPLRSGVFKPLDVARVPGNGLSVVWDADGGSDAVSLHVSEETLAPLYAPTLSWRFGVGARAGELPSAHQVDSLLLTSAAFVGDEAVPLRVANNGQQFSAASAPYTYYAQSAVVSLCPSTGPLAGDTVVVISGMQLSHGHDPRCRFPEGGGGGGAVVFATRVTDAEGWPALQCLAPASTPAVSSALEISLNSQDYTVSGVSFGYVEAPAPTALSPSCGPTDGATVVNVSGGALAQGGSHLQCSFGSPTDDRLQGLVVPATEEGGAGTLRCLAPSRVAGRANVSVTPNAQQFSGSPQSYVYYAPPVVSYSSPASGPVLGATVVVVHGSSLGPPHAGGACDVVCRFGHMLVSGEVSEKPGEGSVITCVTPRNLVARGAALPLEVSLNRQDYSDGLAEFRYTHNLTLSAVVPASGPLTGSTAITIAGDGMVGGDDYRCRWDGPTRNLTVPAVLGPDGNVTCTTPNASAVAPGDFAQGAGYTLSISLNRQQYLGSLGFAFYDTPILAEVSPSSGPVLGGTAVSISGANLRLGDNYTCRFGDDNATWLVVPAEMQGGAVLCNTTEVVHGGAVALRIAHNGQQFSASSVSYEFYSPPHGLAHSPTSGPTAGGTVVALREEPMPRTDSCMYADDGVCDEPWVCHVNTDCSDCSKAAGTNCSLAAGSDRRCRFGTLPLAATVAAETLSVGGIALACVSPVTPAAGQATGEQVLEVSLNGQQYTAHDGQFSYYTPAAATRVEPTGGPTEGGTLVVVTGSDFDGGSDYRCQLGTSAEGLLPATPRPNGTIVCTTPPLGAESRGVTVRLNGQNAAAVAPDATAASIASSALPFVTWPSPRLDGFSPACGPVSGGTAMVLSAAGLRNTSHPYDELRCRFNVHSLSGTFASDSELRCTSPTAELAGYANVVDFDFSDETLADATGTAAAPSSRLTSSGLLLLGGTALRPIGYREPHGYLRLAESAFAGAGAAVLPPLPGEAASWVAFDARFDVRVWGSALLHGMSFCFGELPEQAWAEAGASLGLCVLFRTKHNKVQITLGGATLSSVTPPAAAPIRGREWKGVRVTHGLPSAGLSVHIDGHSVVEGVMLDGFAPTAAWRFGFGARAGPNIAMLEERHDVRRVRISLGAALTHLALHPEVSLNAQQYVTARDDAGAPNASFTYTAPTILSAVSPAFGPVTGSTQLRIAGSGLRGGCDYRCRFSGEASGGAGWREMPATLDASTGDLLCDSSGAALSAAADEVLQVTLNGQQFSGDSNLSFAVHAAPAVASLSPSSGPIEGRTRVTLALSSLREASANHTCRFGHTATSGGALDTTVVVVGATVGMDNSSVRCRAPAAARAGAASVEYSLNAQQYSAPVPLGFTYYETAALAAASPSTGPVRGGTNVTLSGSGLSGSGSHVLCRFGATLIDAHRCGGELADGGCLWCVAPANGSSAAATGQMELSLTLNGQQYSAPLGGDGFRQMPHERIELLSPATGPTGLGGTRIVVRGSGVEGGGSDLRCAFAGGSGRLVLPATRADDGASLLCESPADLAALGSFGPPEGAAADAAVLWQELSVSLNAQQFSNGSSLVGYADGNISSVEPGSGPYLGGTQLNLTLSAPVPDVANTSHGMFCRFGDAVSGGGVSVAASFLDATHLRCTAPTAADAAVLPLRLEEFGTLPEGATLYGGAKVEGGTLRLTTKDGAGSFALALPNMGGKSLSISLDLLLGLGSAADGVSIIYGPLPPHAFDEMGSGLGAVSDGMGNWKGGSGLEVSIRTHSVDLLQLGHAGVIFRQRKMYGTLRTSTFVNLTLTVNHTGYMELEIGAGGAPAVMREAAQLEGWEPQSDWRLGIGGRCNNDFTMSEERRLDYKAYENDPGPYTPGPAGACDFLENAQWVDNLIVRSDQLLTSSPANLTVTLNGQQYGAPIRYGYNAALNLSRVVPPLGPAAGGTALTVHGYSFEGGLTAPNEYACRFGSELLGWQQVGATLLAGYDERGRKNEPRLACTAPPSPNGASSAHAVRLQVSSNGQQFSADSLPYALYPTPIVESVLPAAGPTEGGTLVRVFGSHLHGGGGARRRCRFGDAPEVAASHDATHGALLCFTPPDGSAAAAAGVPVHVSLNAQHYSDAQAAPTFARYAPPQPTALEPPAGFGNGTVLTVNGSALWRQGAQCRFGNALSNASFVAAGAVRCEAPLASEAGAWGRVAMAFSEAWGGELQTSLAELHGTAEVAGGELRLTSYHETFTVQGLLGADAQIGALLLQLPQPALPPHSFRASFRLRMGRGTGADGFSFSYGDLPAGAIGELGAGDGLRVCFRTHMLSRVEVWYAGELLAARGSMQTDGTLRGAEYVPVAISYDHLGSGLRVSHAGTTYVLRLRIAGWAPRRGWRFGLGARTGMQSDDHHIDDLLIEAGSAYRPEPVPLELTLNGLQFSSSGLSFEYPTNTVHHLLGIEATEATQLPAAA